MWLAIVVFGLAAAVTAVVSIHFERSGAARASLAPPTESPSAPLGTPADPPPALTSTPTPIPLSMAGRVIDASTGLSVPAAVVRLASGGQGITDASGAFVLDLQKALASIPVGADGLQRDTLSIEAAGYGSFTAHNTYLTAGMSGEFGLMQRPRERDDTCTPRAAQAFHPICAGLPPGPLAPPEGSSIELNLSGPSDAVPGEVVTYRLSYQLKSDANDVAFGWHNATFVGTSLVSGEGETVSTPPKTVVVRWRLQSTTGEIELQLRILEGSPGVDISVYELTSNTMGDNIYTAGGE